MDIMKLMEQAQQMQARLQEAQEQLEQRSVAGTAAGGMVTVEVDGKGAIQRVRLDPSVVDPSDVAGLEDLILVAARDAQQKAAAMQESEMGKVTGGMDLPFNLGA